MRIVKMRKIESGERPLGFLVNLFANLLNFTTNMQSRQCRDNTSLYLIAAKSPEVITRNHSPPFVAHMKKTTKQDVKNQTLIKDNLYD